MAGNSGERRSLKFRTGGWGVRSRCTRFAALTGNDPGQVLFSHNEEISVGERQPGVQRATVSGAAIAVADQPPRRWSRRRCGRCRPAPSAPSLVRLVATLAFRYIL